jgi:YggT family protein
LGCVSAREVGTLAIAARWAATDILIILIGKVGLSLALFFQILGFALFIFWLLLIARVVVEFIRSFSRDWRPTGVTVVILELIMSITDPPVKLLRRLIPQLTIGAVRFDLSIMVLLLVAFIGMQLAFGAAASS